MSNCLFKMKQVRMSSSYCFWQFIVIINLSVSFCFVQTTPSQADIAIVERKLDEDLPPIVQEETNRLNFAAIFMYSVESFVNPLLELERKQHQGELVFDFIKLNGFDEKQANAWETRAADWLKKLNLWTKYFNDIVTVKGNDFSSNHWSYFYGLFYLAPELFPSEAKPSVIKVPTIAQSTNETYVARIKRFCDKMMEADKNQALLTTEFILKRQVELLNTVIRATKYLIKFEEKLESSINIDLENKTISTSISIKFEKDCTNYFHFFPDLYRHILMALMYENNGAMADVELEKHLGLFEEFMKIQMKCPVPANGSKPLKSLTSLNVFNRFSRQYIHQYLEKPVSMKRGENWNFDFIENVLKRVVAPKEAKMQRKHLINWLLKLFEEWRNHNNGKNKLEALFESKAPPPWGQELPNYLKQYIQKVCLLLSVGSIGNTYYFKATTYTADELIRIGFARRTTTGIKNVDEINEELIYKGGLFHVLNVDEHFRDVIAKDKTKLDDFADKLVRAQVIEPVQPQDKNRYSVQSVTASEKWKSFKNVNKYVTIPVEILPLVDFEVPTKSFKDKDIKATRKAMICMFVKKVEDIASEKGNMQQYYYKRKAELLLGIYTYLEWPPHHDKSSSLSHWDFFVPWFVGASIMGIYRVGFEGKSDTIASPIENATISISTSTEMARNSHWLIYVSIVALLVVMGFVGWGLYRRYGKNFFKKRGKGDLSDDSKEEGDDEDRSEGKGGGGSSQVSSTSSTFSSRASSSKDTRGGSTSQRINYKKKQKPSKQLPKQKQKQKPRTKAPKA